MAFMVEPSGSVMGTGDVVSLATIADVRLYPRDGESLRAFARRVRPCATPSSSATSLQVDVRVTDSGGEAEGAIRAVMARYEAVWLSERGVPGGGAAVPEAAKAAVVGEVYREAVRAGDVCGKWMLFVPPSRVDEAWEKVAGGVEDGLLGCSALVTTCKDQDSGRALICVYVDNFMDRKEVRRVLLGVRALGLRVTSGFKPDALTYDMKSLKPLQLANSWQLHMDVLNEVFPVRRNFSTFTEKSSKKLGQSREKRGFDLYAPVGVGFEELRDQMESRELAARLEEKPAREKRESDLSTLAGVERRRGPNQKQSSNLHAKKSRLIDQYDFTITPA